MVTRHNLGNLNKMKLRKEWIGFFLCLGVLLTLTIILSFQSRKQFHDQVITSTHELFLSELNSIAQDNSLRLLDRDLTLIDLGLPEISSGPGELLEEIIIDTLTLPTVTEALHTVKQDYRSNSSSDFRNIDAQLSTREDSNEPFFRYKLVAIFLLFKIDTLKILSSLKFKLMSNIFWANKKLDRQLLRPSVLSICSGIILLFVIFQFMSRGIRNREIKLEQRNQLLRITNQKLAQAYKSVGLGALSGHLMHSLKTPLTHLQLIAREAEEKKEIDAKELQNVHLNIRELVSESLQALKEFENQNISYQITIGELFGQIIQRTHKTFPRHKFRPARTML